MELDICWECIGHGEDYSYDEETGDFWCNCPDCIFDSGAIWDYWQEEDDE